MNVWVRVMLFVVLVGAVVGLAAYHDVEAGAHEPYPNSTAIYEDYSAHVGEETLLFGTVTDVDESGAEARIRVDTDQGPLRMSVQPFDVQVQPGGVVQVYGRLNPDRVIRASNVEVVNPAGGSKAYKYAISAVGAVLILAYFFRDWQFDPNALAFEVRDDG